MNLARVLLSKAWSGSSMLEGLANAVNPAIKQELPDDPHELQQYVKDCLNSVMARFVSIIVTISVGWDIGDEFEPQNLERVIVDCMGPLKCHNCFYNCIRP